MEKSCNICSLPAGNQSSHLSLIISTKKRDQKAAEGQERQEKLQGWGEYFVFNALSCNYKGGLYVAKYEPFLSQTLDRWYKRVATLNIPPCIVVHSTCETNNLFLDFELPQTNYKHQ